MNQYPNYYGPPSGNPQQFYAPPQGNEQQYYPHSSLGNNQNNSSNGYNSNADFLNKMSPMMSSLSGVGGEMLKSQTSTMASNFSVFWNSLKIYFAVTTGYVMNKLLIILYPFRNKSWIRLPADDASTQYQSSHKFALPRDDINSTDLYIPLMAFASYILLVGLTKGIYGEGFTPDLLVQTIWRCLFLQLIEVLLIMFFIGTKQIVAPFLDLLSYTGYKYVILCINVLFRLFGTYIGLVSTLYGSVMLAIFILKSFRAVVPKTATSGPPGLYIQLACGFLQFIVTLILCFL